jgi:hypothetical protein
MHSTKLIALAACAGLLVAAGCGSDDNSGVTTSGLSKAEWIAQADQICVNTDKEIGAAAQSFFKGKPDAATQQKFIAEVALPKTQAEVDSVRALGAPAGDEDQVKALLDAVDEGLVKAKADPSLVGGPNNPLDEGSRLSKAYGLQKCGAGSE